MHRDAVVARASTPEHLRPADRHVALLFDWDGTVADSQQVNFEVLRTALDGVGLTLDQGWFDARTGVSSREMVRMVADLAQTDVDVDAVAAARDRVFLERVDEVGEVRHVVDVLRAEHGRRRTALATGGTAATVLPTVRALGLGSLFDVTVTRGDVARGKPAPDIFLRAAELLGVDPAGCLVYEDSDEGLQAALTAGMDAVDVRPLR
ncbi:fructose-1-phosphate phosphatase YqaB [Cellulomonas chitinilytica]|uniref:Fructose-1-phosphate phosphatase YqaB n=1 Tax=Cellulomonas chitinilytica TaxID=398759 RepID=A0A919U4N0_9CELL|nr:HAD family phosphatase [Cellulomonas chitinilytica]GIG23617.1 fructose-1-phosphate phosphatase YqaB [Cellulomonas chitinilytica]